MSTLELLASSLTKMNSLVRKYCGDKLELADVEKDEISMEGYCEELSRISNTLNSDTGMHGHGQHLKDDMDGLSLHHHHMGTFQIWCSGTAKWLTGEDAATGPPMPMMPSPMPVRRPDVMMMNDSRAKLICEFEGAQRRKIGR